MRLASRPLRAERDEFPERLPVGETDGHLQGRGRSGIPLDRSPLDDVVTLSQYKTAAPWGRVEFHTAGVTVNLQ